MAMSTQHKWKFAAIHAMVTIPYQWKILQQDENPQTNNQTKELQSAIQLEYFYFLLGY